MAVDYKTVRIGDLYGVEEKQTGYIVYNTRSESDAKKMMKHLNLGGGFSGFSPEFFTKSVSNLINEAK